MDKNGKQEFIIKICCVIAAFALWLFISSTENPLTAYKLQNIPVQLLNTNVLTQSNLVLVPGQDLTTSINIKGASTSIILGKKAEDFTLVADLSAYALKTGEQMIPIEIRKSPNNITVVNSNGLFIKVNLDKRIESNLPINVITSGKPKEGFYASEPEISQSNAKVVGGSKFVNVVKKILVEVNIQDVESNIAKTYTLKPVDEEGKEVKGVVVNPVQIDVKIPIRKTKSVGVTVKTIGVLNPNFTLKSIKVQPERFDVTGSVDALKQVGNLNTEAIDLSKINKSTTMNVKVLIPGGLSLVSGTALVKAEINLDEVVKKNIDEVVQKKISQDIKYINLDEKYQVKLEKNNDSLLVSGTQAVMDSLDLTKISAVVDLANLVEGEHSVKVVASMPEGVNLISQDQDKILVTITKKQTEVMTGNDNKSE
ncbi:hypothetical protein KPL35_04895 [Clostridium sp. CF011]|uniref:CdaR family protein n=1 Tax=unclassified Clostridium TaxID=2614128 RepID=UPI001C0B4355|nr:MULTISPECIES: CdaR family protein [unclassified Clostridium]MBU3091406.1 hypothetical protein [Clostridium sp. CF011]MBW9145139.1 hypothetical protein [Clostridium sp. CM027]UVE40275.1 hypothetical protein KTC92_14250 [Clostridium sp. CM027]WAG69219.1 hypothetical protein LL036_14615 [Clostridium sp. CF011]